MDINIYSLTEEKKMCSKNNPKKVKLCHKSDLLISLMTKFHCSSYSNFNLIAKFCWNYISSVTGESSARSTGHPIQKGTLTRNHQNWELALWLFYLRKTATYILRWKHDKAIGGMHTSTFLPK